MGKLTTLCLNPLIMNADSRSVSGFPCGTMSQSSEIIDREILHDLVSKGIRLWLEAEVDMVKLFVDTIWVEVVHDHARLCQWPDISYYDTMKQ